MAPHGEGRVGSLPTKSKTVHKPSRLSMEGLQRTISDISFELTKEGGGDDDGGVVNLPPISEVEDAKCECCGMSEECTAEYISRVRAKFSGKLICGLCSEAVKEEKEKNGGKGEEAALREHMNACVRFNRIGRTQPVLLQAEAMRELLKKSSGFGSGGSRAKSVSPRDNYKGAGERKGGGLARSSSCNPALFYKGEISDQKFVN